jgi:hypothetical protein
MKYFRPKTKPASIKRRHHTLSLFLKKPSVYLYAQPSKKIARLLYRTSGVIFFIDYCTAIRDTQKEGVEEKETSDQVHRILGHAYVA